MELLIFALVVVIVVVMLCAVAYYIPAPPPFKWVIPALIVLVGAIVILMRLAPHAG